MWGLQGERGKTQNQSNETNFSYIRGKNRSMTATDCLELKKILEFPISISSMIQCNPIEMHCHCNCIRWATSHFRNYYLTNTCRPDTRDCVSMQMIFNIPVSECVTPITRRWKWWCKWKFHEWKIGANPKPKTIHIPVFKQSVNEARYETRTRTVASRNEIPWRVK